MRKSKYKTDFTIYLVMERTTKNAVRYMETAGPDDDTPVTTAGGAKGGELLRPQVRFHEKNSAAADRPRAPGKAAALIRQASNYD